MAFKHFVSLIALALPPAAFAEEPPVLPVPPAECLDYVGLGRRILREAKLLRNRTVDIKIEPVRGGSVVTSNFRKAILDTYLRNETHDESFFDWGWAGRAKQNGCVNIEFGLKSDSRIVEFAASTLTMVPEDKTRGVLKSVVEVDLSGQPGDLPKIRHTTVYYMGIKHKCPDGRREVEIATVTIVRESDFLKEAGGKFSEGTQVSSGLQALIDDKTEVKACEPQEVAPPISGSPEASPDSASAAK